MVGIFGTNIPKSGILSCLLPSQLLQTARTDAYGSAVSHKVSWINGTVAQPATSSRLWRPRCKQFISYLHLYSKFSTSLIILSSVSLPFLHGTIYWGILVEKCPVYNEMSRVKWKWYNKYLYNSSPSKTYTSV